MDYTFCSGSRCRQRSTCRRWIRLVQNEAMIKGSARPVSVSEFADHDGKCNVYWNSESTDAADEVSKEKK